MSAVGIVNVLARYPVKSMGGERLQELECEARGVVGDRLWAVYTPDGGIGSGKTSQRFRLVDGLLSYRARLDGPVPVIETPDGEVRRADDPVTAELLSTALGRPLEIRHEGDVPHYDDSPVHLISTGGLGQLSRLLDTPVEARRFRPNVVLETEDVGFVEDAWVNREMRLGSEVLLRLTKPMSRCVMVGMAQPDLPHDARVLKVLTSEHEMAFGLQAHVVQGGRVREGDSAYLV